MKVVKVYGPGCAKCKQTEEIVRKTVSDLNLDADVVKISDISAMLAAGIMMTPAVTVDDQVKCSGRVPSAVEIEKWIKD